MKTRLFPVCLVSLFLHGCGEGGSSTGPGDMSRIDPAIAGTWVETDPIFSPDTLVFTDAKYRTPWLSGVGTQFSAKGGVVRGDPQMEIVGQYLLSGDTLYFEPVFPGAAPDPFVKSTATAYQRLGSHS